MVFEKSVADPSDARRPHKKGGTAQAATPIQVFFAEVMGTFLLTFIDAGGAIIAALSFGEVTSAARAAAAGLLIMSMIYTLSDVSGAHLNPAVTFAFALRGAFPWRKMPGYWLAQFIGAFTAAVLLWSLFGNVEHVGMTIPHHGALRAVVFETLLTCLLVSVILGTAANKAVVGKNAALAVGGTVALCALFSRPISGASMNPARSLGPAIVGGNLGIAWVYVLGPLLGAALAVLVCRTLHGHLKASEARAAKGESTNEDT
jgi:MIP family channel proteins